MPKPLKKRAAPKPKTDPNEAAADLVRRSTEESDKPETEIPPAQLSAYMAAIGRKGGQIGGKRRLETLTQERRDEIALKAAQARWGKRRKKA